MNVIRVKCSIVRADGEVAAAAIGSIRESVAYTLRSFDKLLDDNIEMQKIVKALEAGNDVQFELKIERA